MEKLKAGIRQRGEKSFQFTVCLGIGGDGRIIRKYATFSPREGLTEKQTIREVNAAFEDFKSKVGGNISFKENQKLNDLAEEYFRVYAPNRLKEVTEYTYKGVYYKNIDPILGGIRLKELTTSRITSFLLNLGHDKKPQTVRKNKIVLHSILNYAVTQKYINNNPCIGTIWKDEVESVSIESDNVLTEAQAQKLWSYTAEYSTFNVIIRLLLLTGLRSGEALGLRWSSIDFNGKTLFVDKTLGYVTGKYFLSSPKTKNSIRKISIDDATLEMLKKHKEEQDKQKAIVGSEWQQPEMVFTSATGHFYDRSLLNTQFRRFIKKHPDLPKVTIHGLRHTNASLLILKGENLDAISKHLGHASADITSRVYSHMLESVRTRVSRTISDIFVGNIQSA